MTSVAVRRPQPMLVDIVFDRGAMILGLRDRTADQTGCGAGDAVNTGLNGFFYAGFPTGDILRACPDSGGGWTIENNSTCTGSGPTTGQNNSQGPGGGEFYVGDTNAVHDEATLAGLVQVPGSPNVVNTMLDPFGVVNGPPDDLFVSGIQWLSNSAGTQARVYEVSQAELWPERMGKAGGLGDLEALSDPAPPEVGDRIWVDENQNGIQDPSEAGIPDVTVRLYNASGILIATAVTDSSGYCRFSNGAGTDTDSHKYNLGGFGPDGVANTADDTTGLKPQSRGVTNSYQVRLDRPEDFQPGGSISGLTLTVVNAGGSGANAMDSDASNVPSPPGSPSGTWPVIPLTTGPAGTSDHTYDAGFFAAPLAVILASFQAQVAGQEVLISWETTSEVNNLGFNLYRSPAAGEPGQQIAWLPSQAPGAPGGATYQYVDSAVLPVQTYWYWLEDLDHSGQGTRHGPVSVTVPEPTAVQLSVWEASSQAASTETGSAALALATMLGLALMVTAYASRRRPT